MTKGSPQYRVGVDVGGTFTDIVVNGDQGRFLVKKVLSTPQNYASAMITMLRSLGIPARLVVGFAPGTKDAQRGGWLVRAENYHAWPEVYFPGHGWVEFEPTPAAVQPSLEAFRTGPEPSSLGSAVMVG